MTRSTALILGFVVVSVSACTATPEPQSTGPVASAEVLHAGSDSVHALRGYVHDHEHSRFAKGALKVSRSQYGTDRYVGEFGVFGFRPKTGLAVGIPNGDSPIDARPRLAGSAEDHNSAVRAYFVSGGLPGEQIARVDALARMTQAYEHGTSSTPQLVCWNSYLRRHVAGVAIKESFAWARFNVDGQVVAEGVYWPELPASVIADATELSAVSKQPASLASFRAKLPSELQGQRGDVAIHHTPGDWAKDFAYVATYDVTRNGLTVHFDKTGAEVKLPHEQPDAYGPLPPVFK